MQTMKEWWVYLLLAGLLFIGGLIMANLMGVNMLEDQIYTQAQQELLSYTNSRIITQAPVTTNFLLSSSGAPGLAPADEEATILPASFSVWENSVQATLRGRFEEQEGISSTLYDLDFVSDYHLQHSPTGVTTTLELIFPFPANLETLSDVQFEVDGAEPDVLHTEWVTSPESLAAEEQQIEEPETRAVVQATPFLAHLHCPQCGRPQAKDYIFCPGCGYDGRAIRQCPNCGHGQVVKEGERAVYCVHCGQSL